MSGSALNSDLIQKTNQNSELYKLGRPVYCDCLNDHCSTKSKNAYHFDCVLFRLFIYSIVWLYIISDSLLAEGLNYSVSNEDDLIEFLHKVDAQLLLKRTFQPMIIPANGTKELSHGWTLTIEGINSNFMTIRINIRFSYVFFFYWLEDKSAVNPFLTETPFDILTHPNYKSDIDAIFSSAPMVCYSIFSWFLV